MRARRDFRHDAAVERVRLDLRGNDVRQDAAVSVEDGDRGLVAGSLDAKNDHGEANPGSGERDSPRLRRSRARLTASARLAVYGGRQMPSSVTIAVT